MDSEFYKRFLQYVKTSRNDDANAVLMKELGRILVKHKTDFIYVLNYAGVKAAEDANDVDLINLWINNIYRNKKLMLGTAFLISTNNKLMSFDGGEYTSNICANAIHKSLYTYFDGDLLLSYFDGDEAMGSFDGEDFSNMAPVVGAIAGALGQGAKLGGQIAQNKGQKNANKPMAILAKQQEAKQKLVQSVLDQRKQELANKQSSEKSKRTKMIVLGSVGGVLILAIAGVLIYKKLKKG